MQNFEACPGSKGCPYYPAVFGKCFCHCDLDSDKTCGTCAHWVGDSTAKDEPHKRYGSCFYTIGRIGSHYKTNCEDYIEKKSGEPD